MSELVKLENGEVLRVHTFERVSTEELEATRLELIDRLAVINDFLGIDTNQDGTVNGDRTTDQPAADAPSEEPTPVVSEPLADTTAPVSEPAPVELPQPEQPTEAAAPAPIQLQ